MTSEALDVVKPQRSGRMTGVNIPIDGETWEYILESAKIPLDTPLERIRVRRYRTKSNRIILKVIIIPEESRVPEAI